jgi:hypothetical protein
VTRVVRVGVIATVLLLGMAVYQQWFKAPSFAARYALMSSEHISINTAFRFKWQRIDRSLSAAVENGRGAIEAHFEGPEDRDVAGLTLFDDQRSAEVSFAGFGRAAGESVDPPYASVYDDLCAIARDRTFSCAALFDDGLVATGVASTESPVKDPDDRVDALRHAYMLVQGAYKDYLDTRLRLSYGSWPYWLAAMGTFLLLVLVPLVNRVLSDPAEAPAI